MSRKWFIVTKQLHSVIWKILSVKCAENLQRIWIFVTFQPNALYFQRSRPMIKTPNVSFLSPTFTSIPLAAPLKAHVCFCWLQKSHHKKMLLIPNGQLVLNFTVGWRLNRNAPWPWNLRIWGATISRAVFCMYLFFLRRRTKRPVNH